MQLNMLEAMNIYVNVVEQGSFIRAAEVLELHRPAVTRAVQNLEHDLGVKLLHRTTRQVSMTDEGEEFYQRCLSLLSELDDVRRLFSRTQPPKGRLRLDVPITLARAVIIPALGDFQNRYGRQFRSVSFMWAGGVGDSTRIASVACTLYCQWRADRDPH